MNNIFIHYQLSFMATINTSSVWSTLIIAINRWEFMHVWMIIVHICMNFHQFLAMINVDQADDMLIVAMKDCWSFMITYIIMSSWNISWPLFNPAASATALICSLFTVHCSVFTVHCSLFTARCSWFTVHYLLFTRSLSSFWDRF